MGKVDQEYVKTFLQHLIDTGDLELSAHRAAVQERGQEAMRWLEGEIYVEGEDRVLEKDRPRPDFHLQQTIAHAGAAMAALSFARYGEMRDEAQQALNSLAGKGPRPA